MNQPTDAVTDYVAHAIGKHALEPFTKSFASAVLTYAQDEYNGRMTFGMQTYENRHRRLLDLASDRNNPFEEYFMDGYPRFAVHHVEFGLVVLYHHNVSRPEYLPNPRTAEKAKLFARPTYKDLFGLETPAMVSRFIGMVGGPTEGLQEIVVGELVRVREDIPKFELANRQFIYRASDDADDSVTLADGPVPPEPEERPTLKIVRRKDQAGDRG